MKDFLSLALKWLFNPHPRITNPESIQRTRLLSAILLILIGLVSMILAMVLRADPTDIGEPTVKASFGLLSVFVIMYIFNRAGYTSFAAIGLIVPVTIIFIYIPFYSGESPIFLAFLLIPIFLSAFFFPPVWTSIFSVSLLAFLFVLISFQDQTSDLSPFWNLRNLWYFLILATGLILTFIWHGTRLENIRQQNLKMLNVQLQQNEARLRSLVENTPDFILEINRQGEIPLHKPRFRTISWKEYSRINICRTE